MQHTNLIYQTQRTLHSIFLPNHKDPNTYLQPMSDHHNLIALLRCLSLTDWTWRECCCQSNEQQPGMQSNPCTVIQVQSTPKDIPINMKAQGFTKTLGLTFPMQLSICIPAFPGSRQNCHYLVYYSHRRASWSIHMVQGSQVKIAVGTFTFSFGGFDYVDFECIYVSCLLLLLMILIPLES